MLDWINRTTPPGGRVARVALEDAWKMHRALGTVRNDREGRLFEGTFEMGDWDVLIVIPRQGMWSDAVWEFVQTHRPARVWTLPPAGGLPVCLAYVRPGLTLPAAAP